MHLIQLFLPLFDNAGNAFPRSHYHRIREELANKFGGLTSFTRAPAEGFWKENAASMARDDIIIFEVMVRQLDASWWQQYKKSLESLFEQDQIIIRTQNIELIE